MPSYDELIKDWEKFNSAYQKTGKADCKIRDDNHLREIADYVIETLKGMGIENAGYSDIRFSEFTEEISGKTFIRDVYMNKFVNGDPLIYDGISHELTHASNTYDETATELYAMEVKARLALEGDRRFEKAMYKRLSRWVQMAIELKARKEGIPKVYEKIVNKIRKKRMIWWVDPLETNDEALYEYGFAPYLKLKEAVQRGKEKIRTEDGVVEITGIKEVLSGLQ